MANPALELAQRYTVQDIPEANRGTGTFFLADGLRHNLLAAFGTQQRERDLRALDRNDYQLAWSGAVAGLLNRWSATPWEIKGEDVSTRHFQNVLRTAHFGAGWSQFLKMLMRDYLRQDRGAFIELIGAGDPDGAMIGPVVGIAYLDSIRCYPTGDPEYPIMYYSREGSVHKMHSTRVVQLVDMPDGDDMYPGYGRCALSRAVQAVQREILLNRFIETYLDDKPPPGINIFQGVTETQFQKAYEAFIRRTEADQQVAFGRQLNFFTLNEDSVKIESMAFSQAPEKFDYQQYVEIGINQLALAIGVDKLDLWEITSSGLGTGAQAEVMASKNKGRTYGDGLVQLERIVNDIISDDCEFAFKTIDHDDDAASAATANAYASFVASVGTRITDDEARQLLANQVPAMFDAITDAEGNIRRMNDVRDQALPSGLPPLPAALQQTTANDADALDSGASPVGRLPALPLVKSYAETRASFTSDFTELVKSALAGETTRRRFGIVLRAQLNRLGRAAYIDGLKEGGVEDGLDDDDREAIADWLAQQSGFVTNFGNEVYTKGLTDSAIGYRAELWANKSLERMRQSGLASADRNGLYEWRLGATEEHCTTCLALNGQKHRLKEYVKRDLLPKSSALSCKGYNCDCSLTKVKGRASGRFGKVKAHHHDAIIAHPKPIPWYQSLLSSYKPGIRISKGADGRRLMLIITSNAYIDRDNEIVSKAALEQYVEGCWDGDTYVGDNVHLLWHKGEPIGDIVYADMHGKFLLEVSRERPDAVIDLGNGKRGSIKSVWDAIERDQDKTRYGASHGFAARLREIDNSVYSQIWKHETSTLPLENASNPYTFSGVI